MKVTVIDIKLYQLKNILINLDRRKIAKCFDILILI